MMTPLSREPQVRSSLLVQIPSGALQLVLSFPSFSLLVVVPYAYFHPHVPFHV
jgi:hypothetical protein